MTSINRFVEWRESVKEYSVIVYGCSEEKARS